MSTSLTSFQAFHPKTVMENSSRRRNRDLSHIVSLNLVEGISVEREVLAMDALELVANVGGYLGLLLGYSFWSLCKGFIRRAGMNSVPSTTVKV